MFQAWYFAANYFRAYFFRAQAIIGPYCFAANIGNVAGPSTTLAATAGPVAMMARAAGPQVTTGGCNCG